MQHRVAVTTNVVPVDVFLVSVCISFACICDAVSERQLMWYGQRGRQERYEMKMLKWGYVPAASDVTTSHTQPQLPLHRTLSALPVCVTEATHVNAKTTNKAITRANPRHNNALDGGTGVASGS